jgi:hypothetical protein
MAVRGVLPSVQPLSLSDIEACWRFDSSATSASVLTAVASLDQPCHAIASACNSKYCNRWTHNSFCAVQGGPLQGHVHTHMRQVNQHKHYRCCCCPACLICAPLFLLHPGMVINIINGGLECGQGRPNDKEASRVSLYNQMASALGVTPGPSTSCAGMRPYAYGKADRGARR